MFYDDITREPLAAPRAECERQRTIGMRLATLFHARAAETV
jgi:hypothetical protein